MIDKKMSYFFLIRSQKSNHSLSYIINYEQRRRENETIFIAHFDTLGIR